MAKFLLIYTGRANTPPTEAEGTTIIQDWTNWFSGLGEHLVDPGNPTSPVAKNISSDGSVNDGAVGEAAAGYSIIKADSLDAAVAMAKGCPQLKSGGQVTVYETFSVQ